MTTLSHQSAHVSLSEISEIARLYFDLMYTGDPSLFERVFHPRAQLFTASEGELLTRSLEDYRNMVAGRSSPREQGATRKDRLLTIDVASPGQALVKLIVRINDAVFLDYLTLIRFPQGWRIVSKTYERQSDE